WGGGAGSGDGGRAGGVWEAGWVVFAHGWPERLEELFGVGLYTAAAVGSFAFGRDVVAVDTNARRVFARLGGPLEPPRGRAAQFNQATMELGATVCTARAPRCEGCPLSEWCDGPGEVAAARRPGERFEGSNRW